MHSGSVPPPHNRACHTVHTDALVVFGGKDSMTETTLRDAWIYDLTTLGSRWIKVRKPFIWLILCLAHMDFII